MKRVTRVYVSYSDMVALMDKTDVLFTFNGPRFMAGMIVDVNNVETLEGYAHLEPLATGPCLYEIVMESPQENGTTR